MEPIKIEYPPILNERDAELLKQIIFERQKLKRFKMGGNIAIHKPKL